MYVDFSSLFHRSSKDPNDKGRVFIPEDDREWPKEWSTIYYKSYPRLPSIALSRGPIEGRFDDVISRRRSHRDFSKSVPLPLEKLSRLLQYSVGITNPEQTNLRAYASGGGRYPLEVYPIVFKDSKELPAGLYHYNVRDHALDVLWQRPFTAGDIRKLFFYEFIQDAPMALVVTAIFWRSQMKYGERGYRYVLLEAGHLAENVCLTAEALHLGCCPMAGTLDSGIERFLDIDGVTESVVHSLILG